jgi:hypothetical protein
MRSVYKLKFKKFVYNENEVCIKFTREKRFPNRLIYILSDWEVACPLCDFIFRC